MGVSFEACVPIGPMDGLLRTAEDVLLPSDALQCSVQENIDSVLIRASVDY